MMALLTAGILVSFATSGIFRLITTSLASKGALKGLQNIYPLMQWQACSTSPLACQIPPLGFQKDGLYENSGHTNLSVSW
jgi:hypothetical protein